MLTANTLFYALYSITDMHSVQTCYSALGRAGGRYTCLELLPPTWQTRKAESGEFCFGYEMFGTDIQLGKDYSRTADLKKKAVVVMWFTVMQRLWDAGKVRSHPVRVLEGGWQGVLAGLKMLGRGDVRGEKLVVFLE